MEVIIRHTEPSDFEGVQSLYTQPACHSGTLQLPYPSLSNWQSRLANLGKDHYNLVALVDKQIVGQIGMVIMDSPRRKHVANIGMAVSYKQQNLGIGTQLLKAMIDLADNWLAIRRIELEVYTDNDAAIALYEKAGFVMEGTARDYAFRDGKFVDTYLMARLAK
ncbi:GNAT family N-acetyltransferase [Shewanella sp. D64]|uniref:GNAT family N-acetyltransferase n=1 Tax=unclassified Shewanella TaxID=196818 RepID=UPI0022BA37C8|nr:MULTISPECIES: GNAT family N-acetyltransferase [unclassified Shewanella]MEC4725739.1 GNAT family N-acetyltransferase [Shewanella sp. D64]MEC4737654.1 GNAT family N-acetyltransferase [Shewanella sp. E94]WBJ93463.1 GNAT family N-acetyltransferase [Shewanella sp. MTB7]